MKKKTIIYVFISLILAYFIFLSILPLLGRPSSRYILIKRLENLGLWRYGVILYIENYDTVPNNLYDVYSYCKENKKEIDLRLCILPFGSLEEEKNKEALKDQAAFIKNIDYEIVFSKNNWYVREKKAYPKYFDKSDLLKISSKGKIYESSLEELGVKVENKSIVN
jgi:hypothetical protein